MRYIHGPDGAVVADVTTPATGPETLRWYHHDHLGSTTSITSSTGAILGTFSYSAFGKPGVFTGTATTSVGWAGAYRDSETGLVYMRARYYDPGTGQFLTRDPLSSVTREPYGYVGNNPINYTDPSGLCWGPTCIVEDVVSTVVEHRHTIIDVATTLGAATVTGACIASVACGVAVGAVGVAAVGIAGVGAHVASDRTFRDDHQISVSQSFFRAGYSTASGVACGLLFTQGCFGSAAFPAGEGIFASSIADVGLSRLFPALFLADFSVLKQGLLAALFPDGC